MRLAHALQAKLATALDHHRRGELSVAEGLYREVLAIAPVCYDALHLLGLALLQRGASEEGMHRLEQAARVEPAQPAAALHLVRALLERGDPQRALAACDQFLAHQPRYAEGWLLRGNALQQVGRDMEAVASYDRALEAQPRYPAALNNQAVSLRSLRRAEEALQALARALEQEPRYPMAWNNRGLALLDRQRIDEAVESFDRALALDARFAAALSNRGTALMSARRFAQAAETFEALVALDPRFGAALGQLIYARRNDCDWRDYEDQVERLVAAVRRGELVDAPLSFMCACDDAQAQLACARVFTAARYPSHAGPLPELRPYAHERIRIAYLSGDFGEHAVSHLLAGLIERHDRRRFEVIACSWGRQNDGPVRARLESAFDRFIDVTALSDVQTAQRLRELEVDIAIDLTGHTSGQRTDIFAQRTAPVQVSYLGYPGTSGAPYLDYLIADSTVIARGEESAYSERIARLPGCYLPIDDRRLIGATPARAALGLPEDGFVFCVFNNPLKITPPVFGTWLDLLRTVPGSVLWLRAGAAQARVNLERAAARGGVDPARLMFAPALESMEAHLARQRCADLFLDTLPYNGHATVIDALWAGLPVLTCRGGSFASRVGASAVAAAGLPELVTENLGEYAALARALALDRSRLATVRGRLEQRSGALFDTERYCRSLERVYAAMIAQVRNGLPPADLGPHRD